MMALLLAQGTRPGQSLGGDEQIVGAGPIGEAVVTAGGNAQSVAAAFVALLSNVVGFMTLLGGIFFLIMFLQAGFNWLMAGGDSGKVDKAKARMTNSAIGLLIMIITVGIVGIVGGVLGLDILNVQRVFMQLIP